MLRVILLFVFSLNLAYAGVCSAPQLFATQFSQKTDELEASANSTSLIGKDIYRLQGNAEVYSHNYYISAEDIEVQKSNKNISAKNNVKIRTGDVYITTDNAFLNTTNNSTNFKTSNTKYFYSTSGANGSADEFITKNKTQILKNSSYSFCNGDTKDWQMKASSITLDKDNNKGIAKDVKLELFGVPVFYAPKYSWVLKGRESGFLSPSFTSYNQNNQSGFQVDIPYYFNLAPEKDFTLTLKNLSTRGQVVNGLYRHLLANNKKDGYFETEMEYLSEDKKTKDKRWLFSGKYNNKLGNYTQLDINVKRVSDASYLRDIDHNNTSDSLNSNIKLSYNKDALNAYMYSENEQVIGNGTYSYTIDLETFIEKKWFYNDINIALSGVRTSFNHKDSSKVQGDRSHIDLNIAKYIKHNAYSFEPRLNINTTDYNLDNATNKKRTMYSAGFDYKFFLERDTTMFKKNILQTLTPRISYTYTPTKSQDDLPNFDSTQSNLTYNGLFLGDDWSGIDRISAANNITIGIDSSVIDNTTGATYGNIGIARSYNIDTNINSNIVVNANAEYGNWKLNNTWQYDNSIVASDNTIAYHNTGIDLFSIGYHKNTDTKKYATLSLAKPITGKSHIFANLNRSVTDNRNEKQTLGFMYDDCCTAVRVSHFKEYTTNNDYDKVIKFEIIFKGLGTTNSKLRQKLQDNIKNYLPEL